MGTDSGVPKGWRFGGFNTPPPKFRKPSKVVTDSTQLWKLLKIVEFRKPTPHDVRKKGSKILKLPSVRNCFTLAMTNKLVVIINSLKVPIIKKILLYEMKLFTKLQLLPEPLSRGLLPPDPRSFCPLPSTEFVEPPSPTEQNFWVRHSDEVSARNIGKPHLDAAVCPRMSHWILLPQMLQDVYPVLIYVIYISVYSLSFPIALKKRDVSA